MPFSLALTILLAGLSGFSFFIERLKWRKRGPIWQRVSLNASLISITLVPPLMTLLFFSVNFSALLLAEVIGVHIQNILVFAVMLTVNGGALIVLEKSPRNWTGALMFIVGVIILFYNSGLDYFIKAIWG